MPLRKCKKEREKKLKSKNSSSRTCTYGRSGIGSIAFSTYTSVTLISGKEKKILIVNLPITKHCSEATFYAWIWHSSGIYKYQYCHCKY